MADIKFYKKGNYIIIEDSVSGKYLETPSSKVEVKKGVLADTDYKIYMGGERLYTDQPIAEIQDEAGSVYSQADFEKFYQHNTGGQVSVVSESSSRTSVVGSATSQLLVAANPERKGVLISNLTDVSAFARQGTGPALVDDETIIPTLDKIWLPTTEAIYVITSASPTGNIVAVEQF